MLIEINFSRELLRGVAVNQGLLPRTCESFGWESGPFSVQPHMAASAPVLAGETVAVLYRHATSLAVAQELSIL